MNLKFNCAVVGGSGALGKTLVDKLKETGCRVSSLDLCPNDAAHQNILLRGPVHDVANLEAALEEARQHGPFDAVLCAAGGWEGGNASAPSFLSSMIVMWEKNVVGASLAARLLALAGKEGALLVFTGAHAALAPTSGMLGYGMAKAAIHHLVASLSKTKAAGLPAQSTVLAILPTTLDTPANRAVMPGADHSTWTPLEVVADKIVQWLILPESKPRNGSLISVITKEYQTSFVQQQEI